MKTQTNKPNQKIYAFPTPYAPHQQSDPHNSPYSPNTNVPKPPTPPIPCQPNANQNLIKNKKSLPSIPLPGLQTDLQNSPPALTLPQFTSMPLHSFHHPTHLPPEVQMPPPNSLLQMYAPITH